MKISKHYNDLKAIFQAGLDRVDPYRLLLDSLSVKGSELRIQREGADFLLDLSLFDRIIVIGFGKATAKMALALEALLGDRITEGLISVKYGHTEKLKRISTIEAGHPVPDENGLQAAQAIAELAEKADQQTLVFTLVSGGGSALIPYPAELRKGTETARLSLEEKQHVTKVLLECGATINEVNCVRKHLSGLKGGRLAERLRPATSVNLILSDVVGDRLDVIASGATAADNSTFQEMAMVVERYGIAHQIPRMAVELMNAGLEGDYPETPKPGSAVFETCHNFLVGTNYLALKAARSKAENLGYESVILTSMLTGEAREVAKVLCAIAKEKKLRKKSGKPLCLLFGGETTVTLKGSGKGGRNQEMALAALADMSTDPEAMQKIWFLAASTDGNDGPTDAAGAFASVDLIPEVKRRALSIDSYLKHNDAYHFFERIDGLLKIGPTNTNVCDIQIFLVE